MLCEHLKCGEALTVYKRDWPKGEILNKMAIKCSDHSHLNHPWQCASSLKPGDNCQHRLEVTCTGRAHACCRGSCGDILNVFHKNADIRTGHQRVRLVGNSKDNVCRGKLQIQNSTDHTWSAVASEETIEPDLACQHMHCGNSTHSTLESDGMQLNCTGKVTQPLLCWDVLLHNSSLMPTLFCR